MEGPSPHTNKRVESKDVFATREEKLKSAEKAVYKMFDDVESLALEKMIEDPTFINLSERNL